MPYAVVHDVPASWEQYALIAEAFRAPVPDGLILHVAGRTNEGFRSIGVWQSEEAWLRFRAGRLGPALAALNGRSHAEPVLRCLRSDDVVSGCVNSLDRDGPTEARRARKERSCSDGSSPARR
jgi:hypothetical protein